MTKIGLLSDTHNYLDPAIFKHFAKCDEIWHAGDLGTVEISDILKKFKPLRAVYGNIDGYDVRKAHTEDQRFYCEKVDVWIRHIGGYPGRYSWEVRQDIKKNPPKLFICGHSHILKVIYDKKLNLLYINPGAAGRFGLHNIRTVVRFIIDEKDIKKLEVIELGN
ncbi:MAG: metallophosphoesterase family protein [Bacteroidota bacterium]